MSSKEEIKESNIKKIKKEIPFIDIKQYSHNIIGLCSTELNIKQGFTPKKPQNNLLPY